MKFSPVAMIVVGAVALLALAGCSGRRASKPDAGTIVSATAISNTVTPPAPGRGGGGVPFNSPSELAHKFGVSVFAPEGVPLHGGVTAETNADGSLKAYGIGLFNGFGALYVAGTAPASVSQFRTAADDDPQRVAIHRRIVQVHGQDAVLFEESYGSPLDLQYRIIWAQNGQLLQIFAPKKVGLATVAAVAEATKLFSVTAVDAANIIIDSRPNPAGDPKIFTDPAEVSRLLGQPIAVPLHFKRILVSPDQVTGTPARWTVELDDNIVLERVSSGQIPSDDYLSKAPPGASRPSIDHPSVGGSSATFVSKGTSSALYFQRQGLVLVLHDASREADESKLTAQAEAVQVQSSPNPSCCSLQLDMDPATAGVQSSRTISGAQDVYIDIVLGDNVGSLGALDMTVLYDDTKLTPVVVNGGALDGNPDFNEAALGGTWNCGLAGSPSPDLDGATGPLHGQAFLSCFNTPGGATITSPTVIATLRLHANAPVNADISFGDTHFTHDDGAPIGTCDPTDTTGLICTGGSVTTP